VDIAIVEDSLDEPNETVILTLSNATNATASGDTVHTHTITDDDAASATVDFNIATSSATEAAGNQTITIDLSAVSGQDVTVDYALTGTATRSGTDYTLAAGTATITAGNTSTTVDIAIVEDSLDEPNETVIVTLFNPSNATLGTNTVHTHTITDDDAASATVDFNATSSNALESVSSANLAYMLSAASGQTVTVDYTVTGTATASTDYTLASGTITIAAGATTANLTIASIVDDSDFEGNETVIVTLSNPSNATLGTNTVHTYTITDNDNILIGTQTWSASNVSLIPTIYNTLGTDYWDAYSGTHGSGSEADEDGYYYTWDAAMNVCPSGWRLPSDNEWQDLEGQLGMSVADQNAMGWRGTDESTKLKVGGSSGFEAKLAGYRSTSGSFVLRGVGVLLWSSSAYSGAYSGAYIRGLLSVSDAPVYRGTGGNAPGYSVRCLKD
jgi:uncharacterized protein (TIGR02145 family)